LRRTEGRFKRKKLLLASITVVRALGRLSIFRAFAYGLISEDQRHSQEALSLESQGTPGQ